MTCKEYKNVLSTYKINFIFYEIKIVTGRIINEYMLLPLKNKHNYALSDYVYDSNVLLKSKEQIRIKKICMCNIDLFHLRSFFKQHFILKFFKCL